MNSRNAWVTLATNDTYSLGALVLAHSLKKVKTAFNLVILITPNVTHAMRGTLQSIFDEIKEVDVMDSGDVENLRLLARPELGITFTKLHCWKLTQYEKCVFLDADTLVLQNCDELFEREEFSAAPDVGWPDCFNSGVFVFKPSEETYKNLIDFAITHGSFDGGDQGLLNMFFADWATGNPNKRLPFLYNLSSAAIYSYLPAFKKFGKGVKIVHFISNSKPWLQPFNSVTKTVQTTVDSTHLTDFLQYWWNLFCSAVHPKLSPEMSELASSFSQMKLEEPSPEEFAKEDLERFQNWEQGNIDYLGRDSFDNILNKISSTIEQNELKFIESSSSNTSTEQNAENELSKFITSSNESGKKSTAILTVEEKPPISFESCFKEQKDEISIEIKEKDIRPLTRIDMAHQFVKKDSDNADTIKEIAVSPISTKDITEEPQVPSASTEKSTIPSHQNINQELSVSLSSLSTTSDIITKTTDCAVSLTKSEASTDITKETTALDIKSSGTASEVSKYKKQEIGESSSTSNDEESLPKQSLNPTEKKKE